MDILKIEDSITITVPTLIRSLAMSSAISCKNLLEGNCDFSWHPCTLLNQYFHYEPVQQVLIWFIALEFIIFFMQSPLSSQAPVFAWMVDGFARFASPVPHSSLAGHSHCETESFRHYRGSRICTPSEKSLWHNTQITVRLFFLSSDIQGDFFLAWLNTCLQFVKPCMRR